MSQEQTYRLVDLIAALSQEQTTLPFDMNRWVRAVGTDNVKFTGKNRMKQAIDCGYAACAAGLGLLTIPSWQNIHAMDRYGNVNGETLTCALGITDTEFKYIFQPVSYYGNPFNAFIKPDMVAGRISEVLRTYGFEGTLNKP